MHTLDWLVVVVYLVWIVYDGLRRAKGTDKVEGYFLGNRSLPWWAVGLSVMATQMSAVTLVGTTGQAYLTGLRFIQFYFGLPLAMIILSVTVVPFFHRAKVYTAYEYLERRFDVRVRSLASFLFLMGRAFSLGVTLAAPAVVISAILGWGLPLTVLVICVPMIVYTSLGGVQAVAWTDVKQMVIIVAGMCAAVAILVFGITAQRGLRPGAAAGGRDGAAQGDRFPVRPAGNVHVLVWNDRRPVPDAGLLRVRPEPGAALSHGEVGGRSPRFPAHERVREDSASVAHPVDRRARLRLLSVPDAADAVQPGLRRGRGQWTAGGRVRRPRAPVRRCDCRAGGSRPRGGIARYFWMPIHACATSGPAPSRSSSRPPATSATPTSTMCFRRSSRPGCPSASWA